MEVGFCTKVQTCHSILIISFSVANRYASASKLSVFTLFCFHTFQWIKTKTGKSDKKRMNLLVTAMQIIKYIATYEHKLRSFLGYLSC